MKNISLVRLFNRIREKRKSVLIIIFASAVLLTAAGVFTLQSYNSYRSEQVTENNIKAEALAERNQQLLDSLESYRTALLTQQEANEELQKYRDTAVLMQLDPEKTDHYILKINVVYPKKSTTQAQKILTKNLKQLTCEKGTEIGAGSLTEVISVATTGDGLELILMHTDHEKAETVLAAVEESLPLLEEEMNRIYKSLRISAAGTEVRTEADPTVQSKQKKVANSLSSGEKQIKKLESGIETAEKLQLSAESKLIPELSFEPLTLKVFLIRLIPVGFGFGLILSAAVLCFGEMNGKEETNRAEAEANK